LITGKYTSDIAPIPLPHWELKLQYYLSAFLYQK